MKVATLKTKYPLNRRDCFQMFKIPINYQTQKTFKIPEACKQIEDGLQEMGDHGYQFEICSYSAQSAEKFYSRKFMRRKVKVKYRCEVCQKNFTSILGTYEIQFCIDKGPNKKHSLQPNNNSLQSNKHSLQPNKTQKVKFRARLYKMICQSCHSWCQGRIYESQLNAVKKSLCVVLAQILDDVPPPAQHKDDRFKLHEQDFTFQAGCQTLRNF